MSGPTAYPISNTSRDNAPLFLRGGGDCGELLRAFNWQESTLGPPDAWPTSLKIAIALMLGNKFGMYIAWGEHYIQFYNDAYRPILGSIKHPAAIGHLAAQTFSESWPQIEPLFKKAMDGETVGSEDWMLQLNRHGYLEDCYFTFCYSPLRDEYGAVGGVLVTVSETTERVRREKDYQDVLGSMSDGFISIDKDWSILQINHRHETVSQIARADQLGRHLLDLFHSGDDAFTATYRTHYHQAMDERKHVFFEAFYAPLKVWTAINIYPKADGGLAIFYRDVSENKKVEKATWDSENQFRTLANSLPQLAWMARADGYIYWYNQNWYNYTGTTAAQMEGWGWQTVHSPVELPKVIERWTASIQNGDAFEMEFPLRNAKGEFRWFLTRAVPVTDESRQITGWIGSCNDIHEQKHAEHQVIDILESISDAFFALDHDFRVTRVNSNQEKLSNLSRNVSVGAIFWDLFPETRNPSSKYWIEYHRVMDERVSSKFTEYFEPLDIWTDVSAFPTPDGGIAVFFRDVSEAKRAGIALAESRTNLQAEYEKFEAVFADAPAALALLRGPNHIFEKVNPKFSAIFGDIELIGKSILDVVPELKDQQYAKLLDSVFKTGKDVHQQDALAMLDSKRTGIQEVHYFDFSYIHLKAGDGSPYGVFIHCVDVTEKFESRKRVENLANELQSAVWTRDEFLSIASHELKTPLTTILLQVQLFNRLLAKGDSSIYAKEKVDAMALQTEKQAYRLNRLVDDMLDITKIRAGKLSIERRQVDLCELVSESIERMKSQFLNSGYAAPELSKCSSATGNWDPVRLEQIINNLFTNAIRYGRGKIIRVKVQSIESHAVLEVTDRGIGIREEAQTKIFDRFERAVDANDISGLGLGLYICKQIAVAHGGKIEVQSQFGGGSTFKLSLPLSQT